MSWCSFQLPTGKMLDEKFPKYRQYGAKSALYILSSINLLNYADRYIPASVKPLYQEDLELSDFQSSLPSTGMIVVFMIFAMIFGTVTDKQLVDRRFMLCAGIIIWSAATSLAGLANNLVQLVCIRSMVGVGEAAYGTIAPPMLSDFYPDRERNVVYGIYYLAIPVGGALGYGVGAVLGSLFGWRVAFLACGVPGILLGTMVLRLNNPVRGINDDKTDYPEENEETNDLLATETTSGLSAGKSTENSYHLSGDKSSSGCKKWLSELGVQVAELRELLVNPEYMLATAGLTFSNFAMGGLADWYGSFVLRYSGASVAVAGLLLGAATIVGGIGGTFLGSKVADYYQTRVKSAYFLIPALFSFAAAVMLFLAINIPNPLGLNCVLIVLAEIFVWTYIAPISAVSINVVPPRLRARSAGLQIFIQHALGDIISPPIIGLVSDSTGSLQSALQSTWIAMTLCGVSWFVAYRFLKPLKISVSDGTASGSGSRQQYGGQDDAALFLVQHDHLSAHSTKIEDTGATTCRDQKQVTYTALLCGVDPLILSASGEVIERAPSD